MRAVRVSAILALGAIAYAPDAFANEGTKISPHEQARLMELELRSLSADRIVDYLLPARDADKLTIELIFDRHEHYNTRTPATAFRFELDQTGFWKGWRVDGQFPIGSSAYWAFEYEPEDIGYVCDAGSIEISSDAAQSLHALSAVDWEMAPTFAERDSSHPTMVGVRSIKSGKRNERYFAYLQSPENPMFELPPEHAEKFEREYDILERYVVELAQEFNFGRTACNPSNSSFDVPRNPTLDQQHRQEFTQIWTRLKAAYAAARKVQESKE